MASFPHIIELRRVEGDEGFSETFLFQQQLPDGGEEVLLAGGMFLGSREDAQWMINLVASLLRREYFRGTGAPPVRFRSALRKANEALTEIRTSRHGLWPGPLHFFVAALAPSGLNPDMTSERARARLIFSTCGSCRFILKRNTEIFGDIAAKRSSKASAQTAAFDTFTSTLEGSLDREDTLLIAIGLPENNPSLIAQCFAIVANPRRVEPSKEEFLSKHLAGKTDLLAGFLVHVPKNERAAEKGYRAPSRLGEKILEYTRGLALLVRLPIRSLGAAFVRPRVWVEGILGYARARLRFALQRTAQGFARVPRMKRHLLLAAGVAAIVVLAVIAARPQVFERNGQFRGKNAAAEIARIEELVTQIEATRIYGDLARVELLFEEARAAFAGIDTSRKLGNALREKLGELHTKVEALRMDIFRISLLSAPEEVVRLDTFPVAFTPRGILVSGYRDSPDMPQKLFIVDAEKNGVYRFDLASHQGKFIFGSISGEGFDAAEAVGAGPLAVLANRSGITMFSMDEERFLSGLAQVASDEQPERITGIAILQNLAYVLEKPKSGGGIIKKYSVSEDGAIGDAKQYFKSKPGGALDDPADIASGATTLFVAAGSPPEILEFSRGKIIRRLTPEVTPALAAVSKIRFLESTKMLILLDSEEGRIVAVNPKDGTLIRQFTHDALKGAIDMWLAETSGEVFALTERAILRFALPPL